ncbi:MAG TPA: ATP-binding protein, partial [Acidimicrobiales bacterium]|nr:ATP-binding protein [Acidimicrobiales bacterium]
VLRRRQVGELVALLRRLSAAGSAHGAGGAQDGHGTGDAHGAGDDRRAPAPPVEVELVGPPGSGRAALAAQVVAAVGGRLLALDAGSLAALPDPAAAAAREARRARLEAAALLWRHADALPGPPAAELPPPALTFYTVESQLPWRSAPGTVRLSLTCGPISRAERLELWRAFAGGRPPAPVAEWALRPGEIAAAARAAAGGDGAVRDVCRRLLGAGTPELVTPLPLPYRWDELVLAEGTLAHLREIEAQARLRGEVLDEWGLSRLTPLGRGTSALFSGPSGTGKTMAAQVLARSLGLELYRLDLAGVVSKYIGETEKHLKAVFAACERAPLLLLIDEADALFGKRTQVSDAHDRYANIEIDYLLQQMERFDGVAVLTTNRKGDLDTAFVRRLRFVVDFAAPSPAERERLWRLALEGASDPAGRPLADGLEWSSLAELDLSPASIKSAALAAAFLARNEGSRIGERHARAAARRELEKHGVVVRPLPETR